MINFLEKHEYCTINHKEFSVGNLYFIRDKKIICLATCIRNDKETIDFVPIMFLKDERSIAEESVIRISDEMLLENPDIYSNVFIKEVVIHNTYNPMSEKWTFNFTIENYF